MAEVYVDLKGREHSLHALEPGERELVKRCIAYAKDHPDWPEYANWWMPEVSRSYVPRGMSRREIIETVAYRIAQDLESRQMLAMGVARRSDERDTLENLIGGHYKSIHDFCDATGISEEILRWAFDR